MFWSKRLADIERRIVKVEQLRTELLNSNAESNVLVAKLSEACAIFMRLVLARETSTGTGDVELAAIEKAADYSALARDLSDIGAELNSGGAGRGLVQATIELLSATQTVLRGTGKDNIPDRERIELLANVVVNVCRIADHFDLKMRTVLDRAAHQ